MTDSRAAADNMHKNQQRARRLKQIQLQRLTHICFFSFNFHYKLRIMLITSAPFMTRLKQVKEKNRFLV